MPKYCFNSAPCFVSVSARYVARVVAAKVESNPSFSSTMTNTCLIGGIGAGSLTDASVHGAANVIAERMDAAAKARGVHKAFIDRGSRGRVMIGPKSARKLAAGQGFASRAR